MAQTLVDLAQLILDSAKRIDGICKDGNHTFPSLDEPLTPDSEAIRMDPQVAMSLALITASADQLIATATMPVMTVLTNGLSVGDSCAARTASHVSFSSTFRLLFALRSSATFQRLSSQQDRRFVID